MFVCLSVCLSVAIILIQGRRTNLPDILYCGAEIGTTIGRPDGGTKQEQKQQNNNNKNNKQQQQAQTNQQTATNNNKQATKQTTNKQAPNNKQERRNNKQTNKNKQQRQGTKSAHEVELRRPGLRGSQGGRQFMLQRWQPFAKSAQRASSESLRTAWHRQQSASRQQCCSVCHQCVGNRTPTGRHRQRGA